MQADEIDVLEVIQRRVLWLSTYMIHHANKIRSNPGGGKVGGHQASSASVVSLMTVLYFHLLQPGDRVSIKPHASPVFHAIQALRGLLPMEALKTLRSYGGLQSYPSRVKDPDGVDFTTGSVGLGAVATAFGAVMQDYVHHHFGSSRDGRYIALLGDAELDEGNVWEAVSEEYISRQANILWIIDLNRQSLDRIVPDGKAQRIRDMFQSNGWHVINLKYGRRLQAAFCGPGGEALRRCIDTLSNEEYQSLIRCDGEQAKVRLLEEWSPRLPGLADSLGGLCGTEIQSLLTDLGGHDIPSIVKAFAEAEPARKQPAVIVAYTIKGWGLPFAGDPLNHSMLLDEQQIRALREESGIQPGKEWSGFPPGTREADYIARKRPRPASAAPAAPEPTDRDIPQTLGVQFTGSLSTQAAFGRILMSLSHEQTVAARLVTTSADVALSTHLAGWIDKVGIYSPEKKVDYFSITNVARFLKWSQTPGGQHIELGISENNLFLLLSALGLSKELTGDLLLPVATIYDSFIPRGLDSFLYAAYSHAKFILVATPSGISLSFEGGAHQSILTPGIGLQMPGVAYYEPAFGQEVEWILLAGLRNLLDRQAGECTYLRLTTKPVDQKLAATPGDPSARRAAVLAGGYRLRDCAGEEGYRPGKNVVHVFAAGGMVPEALQAADRLEAEGIRANVFVVTSPARLYRDFQQSARGKDSTYLVNLLSPEEGRAPLVTLMDGHSHTLSFLADAFATRAVCLGVDDFGQSGTRSDLYRHYGIDADAIVSAARGIHQTRPAP